MDDIKTQFIKEIAKDAYADIVKPIAKPTAEVIGLLPRVIKSACLPIEKWVNGREYNLKETQKLLEGKLSDISSDLIATPEAYIAVPTIQYLSFCMDNEVLRDMFANLLANAMRKDKKALVHPSYVEIIKQMSPHDALMMKRICEICDTIPVAQIKFVYADSNYLPNAFPIFYSPYFEEFEDVFTCSQSIEILNRFGLINLFPGEMKEYNYNLIKDQKRVVEKFELAKKNNPEKDLGVTLAQYIIIISDFGKGFANVCL